MNDEIINQKIKENTEQLQKYQMGIEQINKKIVQLQKTGQQYLQQIYILNGKIAAFKELLTKPELSVKPKEQVPINIKPVVEKRVEKKSLPKKVEPIKK